MIRYRYRRSIWEIDTGNRTSMRYRYKNLSGIRYVDMVIYHVDMVIQDIDMGYGLMIWEMTVSIRSSPIYYTGAKAEAWCLPIHADASLSLISHIDMGYLVTLLLGPTLCGISTSPVVPQATMLARPAHRGSLRTSTRIDIGA
jgi:hypothetical protein